MEITWIGIIASVLLLFWVIRHKLTSAVRLAIFFLPFGSIAVVNVHRSPGFGVGLDHYFALLLMVSLFSFCVLRKYQMQPLPAIVKVLLFLLLVSIIISWIPLIYSDGLTTICKHTVSDGFFKAPLVYSIQNITKTVYLLFSMLFFIAIYNSLNLLHPLKIARIIIISCMIITISGLLDFVPASSVLWKAMMNNISYGVFYTGLAEGPLGIPRISGLMAEPSHLIQITLFGLSMIVVFFFRGITVFSKKKDMLILSIFIMVSILTYSPMFLGGFFVILGYCSVKSISKKYLQQKLAKGLLYGSVVIGVVVLLLKYYIGVNILYATVVTGLGRLGMAKELAGFSSTFRVQCIQSALETFRTSPLFGAGWGSLDMQVGLPFLLLANVGILGFIIFVSLLLSLVSIGIQKNKRANNIHEYALREGFLLAGFIIMCIFMITKGTLFGQYLPIWFIAAGMIGSYNNTSKIKPCEELCE